jgi:hypothetical protein
MSFVYRTRIFARIAKIPAVMSSRSLIVNLCSKHLDKLENIDEKDCLRLKAVV